MLPVLLLAGTVVAWATLDAMRKRLAGQVEPVPLAIALAAGTLPLFAVWVAIDGWVWPAPAYWGWALSAAVVNIAGAVLLLAALRVAPLSVVIPLLSLSPVMSAGVGWVLLGELPALTQWAGMGLVVLGAALLGATGEGRANVLGVVMGATVALCFAATIVLDKGALQYVRAPQHGLWTGLTIAGGLLGWLAARGRLRSLGAIGKQVGWIVAAAGTLAAALGLQLLAVQLWLVSVVEGSKRAIGMSAAIVLGSVLFGESISAGKLVAIGLMIAGVVLLV